MSSNSSEPKLDSLFQFLDIGKKYNVYGMIVDQGQLLYYICDREHHTFPVARPSYLFNILDNRLSRYWVFGIIERFKKYPLWIFSEWINEPYFQDYLTDGQEREVEIFKKYKELMDLEFPDSSITEVAQIIDDNWLMCPFCIDAWESKNEKDALIKCHTCNETLNNPRYKNTFPHI